MGKIKENIQSTSYSEELKRYINKKDVSSSTTNEYIIIVEYKDNTFASAKLGG